MTCPICGGKTKVDETVSNTEEIYRRRECKECGYTFYTTEAESTSDGFYQTMREKHPQYNRAWRRTKLAQRVP